MRQCTARSRGAPGERADSRQRRAPALRAKTDAKELQSFHDKMALPVAAVLADIERNGVRVDPKALDAMSLAMEKEVRRLEKEIWEMAGTEFNVNSPTQLAEILFDKLNLLPPVRRGR